MKSDLAILIGLIILFVATFLLCDQRDMAMDAQNARIALLEEQIGHSNIPRITVTGRTSIYSADGEIVMQELKD
jgi:hypothetical protein